MSAIKASFIFGVLLTLLSSCKSKEERLCNDNTFFCMNEKKQHDEAKKLGATQLYQEDIAYYKVTNGGNSLIEDELGGRGVSAINALYEKDVIRDLNGSLLVSNLDSVDRKSGINICASPYYDSIIKYLTDIDKRSLGFFSDRAKLTKIYCSSKSESLTSDR